MLSPRLLPVQCESQREKTGPHDFPPTRLCGCFPTSHFSLEEAASIRRADPSLLFPPPSSETTGPWGPSLCPSLLPARGDGGDGAVSPPTHPWLASPQEPGRGQMKPPPGQTRPPPSEPTAASLGSSAMCYAHSSGPGPSCGTQCLSWGESRDGERGPASASDWATAHTWARLLGSHPVHSPGTLGLSPPLPAPLFSHLQNEDCNGVDVSIGVLSRSGAPSEGRGEGVNEWKALSTVQGPGERATPSHRGGKLRLRVVRELV